jgi:pyridoxal phosphate enzyme (YggS family)
VRGRIDAACVAAGRDPEDVRLLPVSKTHPVSLIEEAMAAGCQEFGENRVQEIVTKAEAFDASGGAAPTWVLIGHLQRNKVAAALRHVGAIHSLDSLALAETLDRHLAAENRTLDVLVQVNTSGEATKSGLSPDDVLDFTAQLSAFEHVRPRGLMTIALPLRDPASAEDRAAVTACFTRLSDLRARLRDRDGGGWDDLSMGMSHDLELAIAAGSTCVRVGTALFGVRGGYVQSR